MSDPYAEGVYRWWHLSAASPELLAATTDGWLGHQGEVLDIGCGLGSELAFLVGAGWRGCGVDLSAVALRRAKAEPGAAAFVQADAMQLPFTDRSFGLILDRGCFHYIQPGLRSGYSAEAERVLRPGGRLFLRACLTSAGVRNDITEAVIASTFRRWQIDSIRPIEAVSDTRVMRALEARLVRVGSTAGGGSSRVPSWVSLWLALLLPLAVLVTVVGPSRWKERLLEPSRSG
jgi:SAM-dependent methyltransferase